jgi:light-regulated signal transduction histidine kinase (bacteriophytochrome)
VVSERRDRIDKLEQQSERLALLNRILRHDILNNSTIIAGTVDLLEDRVDEAEQNQITAIRRANESTIKLTETARTSSD